MKQEDKNLLLQDLCSRLPYNVKCDIGDNKPYTLSSISNDYYNGILIGFKEQKNGFNMEVYLSECKPYLYPLLSMTEEQKKEWQSLMIRDSYGILYHTTDSFDYIYKNHIDIRGLIPKGLALDATGLNIY